MAEGTERQPVAAGLNEVADVLSAMTVEKLRSMLVGVRPLEPLATCDYHCECNHTYCTCRGSVSKALGDRISYPEFLAIRERRMRELKEQLTSLETPGD
jgi:hypothetical protein